MMHRLTQATRIRWPAESVIYITLTESPKSPKTCNTCASASASVDVEIPTGGKVMIVLAKTHEGRLQMDGWKRIAWV